MNKKESSPFSDEETLCLNDSNQSIKDPDTTVEFRPSHKLSVKEHAKKLNRLNTELELRHLTDNKQNTNSIQLSSNSANNSKDQSEANKVTL